jgi:trehalose-6-phosphatase
MIVIVDIDNTLSINKKRYELATKSDGSIDWNILYDYQNVISDKPNLPMIDIVNHLYNDYGIYILTGRPRAILNSTQTWLEMYKVNYDGLFMRSEENHYIKDVKLKEKMYNDFVKDEVYCAFDDRQDIIDLWRRFGIPYFKFYL